MYATLNPLSRCHVRTRACVQSGRASCDDDVCACTSTASRSGSSTCRRDIGRGTRTFTSRSSTGATIMTSSSPASSRRQTGKLAQREYATARQTPKPTSNVTSIAMCCGIVSSDCMSRMAQNGAAIANPRLMARRMPVTSPCVTASRNGDCGTSAATSTSSVMTTGMTRSRAHTDRNRWRSVSARRVTVHCERWHRVRPASVGIR